MVARKCKGCGSAVKGHVGPVGLGKCKNSPAELQESENQDVDPDQLQASEPTKDDTTVNTDDQEDAKPTAKKSERGRKPKSDLEEVVKESTSEKKSVAKGKRGKAAKSETPHELEIEEQLKEDEIVDNVSEDGDNSKRQTAKGKKPKKKPESPKAEESEESLEAADKAENDSVADVTEKEVSRLKGKQSGKKGRKATTAVPTEAEEISEDKEQPQDDSKDAVKESVDDIEDEEVKKAKGKQAAKKGRKGKTVIPTEAEEISEDKEQPKDDSIDTVRDSVDEIEDEVKKAKGKQAAKKGRKVKRAPKNDAKNSPEDTEHTEESLEEEKDVEAGSDSMADSIEDGNVSKAKIKQAAKKGRKTKPESPKKTSEDLEQSEVEEAVTNDSIDDEIESSRKTKAKGKVAQNKSRKAKQPIEPENNVFVEDQQDDENEAVNGGEAQDTFDQTENIESPKNHLDATFEVESEPVEELPKSADNGKQKSKRKSMVVEVKSLEDTNNDESAVEDTKEESLSNEHQTPDDEDQEKEGDGYEEEINDAKDNSDVEANEIDDDQDQGAEQITDKTSSSKGKKKLLSRSASEESDGGDEEPVPPAGKGNIRQRLFSKSDKAFDIRPFIKDRSFLLCRCFMYEGDEDYTYCECEGIIHLDNNLSGSVVGTFYNPGDDTVDVLPIFSKSTWVKLRPNEMKFTFKSATDKSVKSVSGQILISSERSVERVKGRKFLTIFLTGVFNLSITGKADSSFGFGGSRKSLKYREITFDLIETEQDKGAAETTQPKVAENTEELDAESSANEE